MTDMDVIEDTGKDAVTAGRGNIEEAAMKSL